MKKVDSSFKGFKIAKYIRVSSDSQKLDRQRNNDDNVKLYEDKISGVIDFNQRPAGKRLIRDIEVGKINYVILHSVDRLGRNVIEMQKMLNWFIENKIQIKVENLGMELLDEEGKMNPIAKMILDLLSSVASLELENIKERQKQGVEIAKAKGVYQGRKLGAVMSDESFFKRHKDVVSLLKDGLSLNKISNLTSKSFITVKRVNVRLNLA